VIRSLTRYVFLAFALFGLAANAVGFAYLIVNSIDLLAGG